MSRYHFPALSGILAVERTLGNVLGPHVYVGGACVGFYVDDPGSAEVRPTDDVDVVVELASETDRTDLDERLRGTGLHHDLEGPICRWRLNGLKVDVMPADAEILGFSNRWYAEALSGALAIEVEDQTIRIPHVCTFIATKMEAFADRGNGDFIASSDFEDIVRIFDGCTFLEDQAASCPLEVQAYLRKNLGRWFSNLDFRQAVAAHLMDDGAQDRTGFVLARMHDLVSKG